MDVLVEDGCSIREKRYKWRQSFKGWRFETFALKKPWCEFFLHVNNNFLFWVKIFVWCYYFLQKKCFLDNDLKGKYSKFFFKNCNYHKIKRHRPRTLLLQCLMGGIQVNMKWAGYSSTYYCDLWCQILTANEWCCGWSSSNRQKLPVSK